MYDVYQYLDTRYKNTDSLYQVKIAICKNRHTDYVGTGVFLSKEQWVDMNSGKCPKSLQQHKDRVVVIEDRVKSVLKSMVTYNIKLIRKLVKDQEEPVAPKQAPVNSNVYDWFDLKMEELVNAEAFGTRDNYLDTKNFLIKYTGLKQCPFLYFTVSRLNQLKKRAIQDMSPSNVDRHYRHLRHIFNIAILEKIIDKDIYPFHKRGVKIPQTRKTRKSLSREDMARLFSYVPKDKDDQRALDYFTWSYYGNGMNMKDVAYLRYSNIRGNTLVFYREKTKNTSTESVRITVAMTPEMWGVISRQGNKMKPGSFIFPIISDKLSKEQQYNTYKDFHAVINRRLDRIRKELEIPIKVTHGISRFAFATALKRSHSSTEEIQEALGHTNPVTTQHYLDSFEQEVIAGYGDKLRNYARN